MPGSHKTWDKNIKKLQITCGDLEVGGLSGKTSLASQVVVFYFALKIANKFAFCAK